MITPVFMQLALARFYLDIFFSLEVENREYHDDAGDQQSSKVNAGLKDFYRRMEA